MSPFSSAPAITRSQRPEAQDPFWPWLYSLVKPLIQVLCTLFFQVKILGLEHWPPEQSFIIAPKHSSRWDPLLISLLSAHPLRYVATHTEFQGFQGWLIRHLGTIPVVREQAGASTVRAIETLLLTGHPVVLFPEGGIRPGYIGLLKQGLARMAINIELDPKFPHSLPIVPIAIVYEPAPQLRAKVTLEVLPPLYPKDYCQFPYTETPTTATCKKQWAQTLTDAITERFTTALNLPVQTLENNPI